MTVLLIAALLPAFVLLFYVYKKDSVEKEPVGLVLRVFLMGAAMGPVAAIIENVLFGLFESRITNEVVLLIADFFIGVALVEELCKYACMNSVRNSPAFNYVFDGIVYGAAAALGFAALENVLYVFDGGFAVAVSRAIFAVPGHCADGIIMGCFFGLAHKYALLGDRDKATSYRILSIAIPVLEHGFYDSALTTGIDELVLAALAVEVVFFGFAIYMIHRVSKIDTAFATPTAQRAIPASPAAAAPRAIGQQAVFMGQQAANQQFAGHPVMGQQFSDQQLAFLQQFTNQQFTDQQLAFLQQFADLPQTSLQQDAEPQSPYPPQH